MSIHEIVLAETKPETEWVDWADAGRHGRVGTEWRFRVAPSGEIVRPLVPDVSYLSYATVARNAAPEVFQVPLGAPTVAAEILSPDNRLKSEPRHFRAGNVLTHASLPEFSLDVGVLSERGKRC